MSWVYKSNPSKKNRVDEKKEFDNLDRGDWGRNCSGSDCVGYLGLQGVHHIVAVATINHCNSHPMLGGLEELVLWNR